jgi:FtsP/CotA-like multicopper oxidase with cupredoxin domain
VSRVETPDLPTLGWQMSGGVKEFHLTAAPVRTEFMTGRPVDAWGFNGSMPGPTIEITEGDRVRIFVKNELPEPFSMHWHGLEVPTHGRHAGHLAGGDPAGAPSLTSSRSISTAPSSTTRTWRCRN